MATPLMQGVRFGITGLVVFLVMACSNDESAPAPSRWNDAPYSRSELIRGVTFDWSTHRRLAPGSDNWPLTWAADGHQYTSWGDGGGFGGTNNEYRVSLGIARIDGSAHDFVGRNVWGASGNSEAMAKFGGKTYGLLALGEKLYLWNGPGSNVDNLLYQRLYRSDDHGRSWRAGSVEWTLADHGIGIFTFLQFGKDYEDAPDDSIYIYSTELHNQEWAVQKPGHLILLRVPRTEIENQGAYQFFSGTDARGRPLWGSVEERKPVFEDPNGIMHNSVIYHPCLDRYLLITNHTQWARGNVAIFEAPEPWGPWQTVSYQYGWPGGENVEPSTFFANISPKWSWRENAAEFVFVFTGRGENDSWNSVDGRLELSDDSTRHCVEERD